MSRSIRCISLMLAFVAVACRQHTAAPVVAATPALAPLRPVLVITPPAPTVIVAPAAPFPAAPAVSGHGVGGTCEAACRVEMQSYLRTVCGNEHGGNAGAFREMDRECRNDSMRDYRDCLSRCRH